jgi:hypothetical protein
MRRVIDYDRCSDPSQIKGTTFDRQGTAYDQFIASGNGEYTPHPLKFRDAGRSAFRGNKQKHLDELVKLINEGKEVVSGDILFCEHTDRLSRKDIMTTLDLHHFIFKHGIDIAISSPAPRIYRHQDRKQVGVVFELAGLAYANWLYSQGLSDKVSGFWVSARKRMREGWRFAANCPAWLRWTKEEPYSKDPDAYAILPETAPAILYMVERTLQGTGVPTLLKELHERFTAFGRKPRDGKQPCSWNKTYIRQILRGREILGEYQPGKNKITVDAAGNETVEYVTDGDPIPNYYPALIDEETWQALQESIENRKREKGPTKDFVNLFTGIVWYAKPKQLLFPDDDLLQQAETSGAGAKSHVAGAKILLPPQCHGGHYATTCKHAAATKFLEKCHCAPPRYEPVKYLASLIKIPPRSSSIFQ